MDKIELHQLCGYLPYGLKMYAPYGFRPNRKESTGEHRIVYLTGDLYADIENNIYQGEVFKPILRPMSDLEASDNKYLEQINEIHTILYHDGYFSDEHTSLFGADWLPYAVIQKLYEWHFDIHYLIEEGLAIDLNTLNTK